MPLLDHFRPPLSKQRHWHAFQNSWATYWSSQLNARLPDGYFAKANMQFGVEIDVATFEESGSTVMGEPWTAPAPQASLPIELSGPVIEIGIFCRNGGPTLAGAIELVSPANKDRPSHREGLVSKCATYIQVGIGLILVDVVTERPTDFHRELLLRLGVSDPGAGPALAATAYRTADRDGSPVLDLWQESLSLGASLPTLPLWLRGGLCLPVDLEAAYERTCSEQRLRDALKPLLRIAE